MELRTYLLLGALLGLSVTNSFDFFKVYFVLHKILLRLVKLSAQNAVSVDIKT